MALYTCFLNEQVIIVFRLCLLVMMIIRESLSNNVEHFLSTCWLPYHICVILLDFARSTRVPFQKNRFAHSLALQASWSSFHQAQLHGIDAFDNVNSRHSRKLIPIELDIVLRRPYRHNVGRTLNWQQTPRAQVFKNNARYVWHLSVLASGCSSSYPVVPSILLRRRKPESEKVET